MRFFLIRLVPQRRRRNLPSLYLIDLISFDQRRARVIPEEYFIINQVASGRSARYNFGIPLIFWEASILPLR